MATAEPAEHSDPDDDRDRDRDDDRDLADGHPDGSDDRGDDQLHAELLRAGVEPVLGAAGEQLPGDVAAPAEDAGESEGRQWVRIRTGPAMVRVP